MTRRTCPSGPGSTASSARTATTADMIFTCAQMIEHLSAAFTLEPGMVISTGTPAGVAAGEIRPDGWRPATR